MSTVGILLAAGSSTRMGFDKLWADIEGRPLLALSMEAFAATRGMDLMLVVASQERMDEAAELAESLDLPCSVDVIAGGSRRQDSVAAALFAEPHAQRYLVHDAARPLAGTELAERVMEASAATGAAIPVVPVIDTVKRVAADGHVVRTIDRNQYRAVQTPQAFAGELLRHAHAQAGRREATDDAALVERVGGKVVTVPGNPANIKVTTVVDLAVVRALVTRSTVLAYTAGRTAP